MTEGKTEGRMHAYKKRSGRGVQPLFHLRERALVEIPHETVVKGDSKSISIAAASILAKVSRDRFICEMAEKYPQYEFEKHKGYGTKVHNEAILKYGPCEIHRKTFLKKLLGDKI